MKDFTKWVEAWNTYIHPPTKRVPLTAAELSANEHVFRHILAVLVIITLIECVLYWLKDKSHACGVLFAIGFPFALLGVYIMTLFALGLEAQSTKTVYENVPRPASFTVQVEEAFDVRNLSCPAKVMDATSLPDAGSYQCVITYGANDANLRKATLVVADGNKVGLYDHNGELMKVEKK